MGVLLPGVRAAGRVPALGFVVEVSLARAAADGVLL
jgi:hypothetical protein